MVYAVPLFSYAAVVSRDGHPAAAVAAVAAAAVAAEQKKSEHCGASIILLGSY